MDFALELAARHRDVVVVSDEAYLAYSGATNLPRLAAHPNLVVMRTLSKIGMAGLRVGFTISSPAIAALLEKVRPPYNLSALDQRAAALLVDEAARVVRGARAPTSSPSARRLAAGLAAAGLEVFPSEANLVLVRCPDAPALWRRLADAGISVRAFGARARSPIACGSPSARPPRPTRCSRRSRDPPSIRAGYPRPIAGG